MCDVTGRNYNAQTSGVSRPGKAEGGRRLTFQATRNAELWQIWQGHPHRAFSEILQSCDQGKRLQKEGQKKHPGANAIIS